MAHPAPGQQRFLSAGAYGTPRPWPAEVFISSSVWRTPRLASGGFYQQQRVAHPAPGQRRFLSAAACGAHRPWPAEVFISSSVWRTPRLASRGFYQSSVWRTPRLASSGFYQQQRVAHIAPGQQRFLFHCSVGRTSGMQIGSRQRAGSGVGSMPMKHSEHCRDSICVPRSSPSQRGEEG